LKLKRAYTPVLSDSEIDQIISEAESNPPSECWEFATDQTETLLFLEKQLRQEGKIKIEI
jgi:hypothetical protein